MQVIADEARESYAGEIIMVWGTLHMMELPVIDRRVALVLQELPNNTPEEMEANLAAVQARMQALL